jgi:hypothetical protein
MKYLSPQQAVLPFQWKIRLQQAPPPPKLTSLKHKDARAIRSARYFVY